MGKSKLMFGFNDVQRKELGEWMKNEIRRQREKEKMRENMTILDFCFKIPEVSAPAPAPAKSILKTGGTCLSDKKLLIAASVAAETPVPLVSKQISACPSCANSAKPIVVVSMMSQTPARRFHANEKFSENDVKTYLRFLESDHLITKFLRTDYCKVLADSYLLAEVFVLFRRAKINSFTRMNFFKLLFLAHEMEEDQNEARFSIFPWALGPAWSIQYPEFIVGKDDLWKAMDFRSIVDLTSVQSVIQVEPDHPIWKRERLDHHIGALPAHMQITDEDENEMGYLYLREAGSTPPVCAECVNKLRQKSIPTRLTRRLKPYPC